MLELLKMPRTCLKQEDKHWFCCGGLQSAKNGNFSGSPQSCELVLAAVTVPKQSLGLTPNLKSCSVGYQFVPMTAISNNQTNRFMRTPIYHPKMLDKQIICDWLRAFHNAVELEDKHGKRTI